ncbi:MAG: amidohydrolase family protein [Eubacteriales bacterium]|nr:amidohydrolase family protein [Eubacteriales bacterium]
MALFQVTDYDKHIWETELKDWLPDNIIDVHTHVWLTELKDQPKKGKEHFTVSWPSMVAPDNSIEDLQETYELMFPGKKVKALMFTSGGASAANNNYVSESSKKSGFPALYYSHPSQTREQLFSKIVSGGFLGIKCYLSSAPKYIPDDEIRITDFFPPHQLELMNDLGGIVMCHIPRSTRLKDPMNYEQIAYIKETWPNIRFIVAHIGRAYSSGDIGNAFDRLDQVPDLMYDFCANCSEYAITELLKHAGPKHAMFGTDMPILRMRTRRIEENGTYINLVEKGLYGDVSGDSHMREVSKEEAETITFFAYEELLALKRAWTKLGLTKEDLEDIMFNSAYDLINGASKDILGKPFVF